jgi:hypothetical protein
LAALALETTGAQESDSKEHHVQLLEAPRPPRRVSTETKASVKTSELVAYVAAVLGVLIASAIVDATDFGAQEAWFYVTLLTIGYLVSRGLAKSGSRDFYTDDNR